MISEFVYAFVLASLLFFVAGQCAAHDADGLMEPATLINNPCGRYIGITKSPYCKLESRVAVLEKLLREAYQDACKPRGSYKCTFAVPPELGRGY